MPDIIETQSSPDANSYASIDEADEYLDSVYGADEWVGLNDDDKARLLISATRMIDGLSVIYDKAVDSQALKFPVLRDGAAAGMAEAREASIIQAFYLYQNWDGINEAQQGSIQGVKAETMGPTNKTVTGFNVTRRFDPSVYRLLGKYMNLGVKIYRG